MFEWDEKKNQSNLTKHGLDFRLAVEIFSDPRAVEQLSQQDNDEVRYQIIGSIEGNIVVLFVVFTKRGEKRRIISARKASKKERLLYEYQKIG